MCVNIVQSNCDVVKYNAAHVNDVSNPQMVSSKWDLLCKCSADRLAIKLIEFLHTHYTLAQITLQSNRIYLRSPWLIYRYTSDIPHIPQSNSYILITPWLILNCIFFHSIYIILKMKNNTLRKICVNDNSTSVAGIFAKLSLQLPLAE